MKTEVLYVRIPESTKKLIDDMAFDEGKTIASLVSELLELGVHARLEGKLFYDAE